MGGVEARSDTAGIATFRVAPGRYRLEVAYEGMPPETREIAVRADTSLVVVLRADALRDDREEEHDAGELETVIVTATRSPQRIDDAPVRVEVLAREEVEDKAFSLLSLQQPDGHWVGELEGDTILESDGAGARESDGIPLARSRTVPAC